MNTYERMKIVINRKMWANEELLEMCDTFLMNKRVEPEEYNDLVKIIKNNE